MLHSVRRQASLPLVFEALESTCSLSFLYLFIKLKSAYKKLRKYNNVVFYYKSNLFCMFKLTLSAERPKHLQQVTERIN